MSEIGKFVIKKHGEPTIVYKELEDVKQYWPGRQLPVAEPKCGFKGEKCSTMHSLKISGKTSSK